MKNTKNFTSISINLNTFLYLNNFKLTSEYFHAKYIRSEKILGMNQCSDHLNSCFPDKAKLSARRGRKAAGLLREDGRAAEGRIFGKDRFERNDVLAKYQILARSNNMSTHFERRKHIRRDLPVMMKIDYALQHFESKLLEGFVSNFSSSGLCLLTSYAIDIGQEIILNNNLVVPFQTARVQWIREVNTKQYSAGLISRS
jgi:hypothetical protein